MKILICSGCGRKQGSGKFCLDCGSKIEEQVISGVSFKKINTGRSSDKLKKDVRNWLARLGVKQSEIQISRNDKEASIEYVLNVMSYLFTSSLQDNYTNNLAAIEQFLHYRVLSIERGIETIEQAFKGYEALPDYTTEQNFNPYTALGFKEEKSFDECNKKYRELAKRFHPDVNDSDYAKEQFQLINKAIKLIQGDN